MNTKLFSVGLLVCLSLPGLAACGGGNDNSAVTQGTLTEDAAKQKATTYVPGAVGDVQRIATSDEDRWAVSVGTPGGGAAVVELDRVSGELAELNSDKGPFEYDLPSAGPGILLYANARTSALAAKPGSIDYWELKMSASTWEFYVKDADQKLWEVKLDAKSGSLLSAVQKDTHD